MAEYTCQTCNLPFQVGADVLARFPGWTPRFCMKHRGGKGAKAVRETPSEPRDPSGAVDMINL